MAEHGERERRIHHLVPARQPRQRQVELALLVPVMEAALARYRVPRAAARQPERAALVRDLRDAVATSGG